MLAQRMRPPVATSVMTLDHRHQVHLGVLAHSRCHLLSMHLHVLLHRPHVQLHLDHILVHRHTILMGLLPPRLQVQRKVSALMSSSCFTRSSCMHALHKRFTQCIYVYIYIYIISPELCRWRWSPQVWPHMDNKIGAWGLHITHACMQGLGAPLFRQTL